jgi:hypothetical protein
VECRRPQNPQNLAAQAAWSHVLARARVREGAAGDPGRIRSLAVEIVATNPDVIFTSGFSTIRPLLDVTSTLPIVFANVVDPVGARK